MKRAIGIGGVFFKSENPEALRNWYKTHLGIDIMTQYGASFNWNKITQETKKAYTVWSPFEKDTSYFNPSEKPFMLNFIVDDLDALLPILEKEGVEIVGKPEKFDYGKFAWILDPEGNKLELWEPVPEEYDKLG